MKQKQSIFSTRWQKSYLLFAAFFVLSSSAFSQANYWSIFGSSSSICGGFNSFAMNATANPTVATSFIGINTINDIDKTSAPLPAAYTTYNTTGQPLFSVDQNGIYDGTGAEQYDFGTSGANNFSTYAALMDDAPYIVITASVGVSPGPAVSEVCTFPASNTAANSSYWVVFWAQTPPPVSGSYLYQLWFLRAIQINLSAAGAITVTLDTALSDPSSTGFTTFGYSFSPFSYAIAADAAPCGGARNVYTLEPAAGSGGYFGSNLRKWTFPADGSYPAITAPTLFDNQNFPAYSPKAKIVNIAGKKYFSFISGGYC